MEVSVRTRQIGNTAYRIAVGVLIGGLRSLRERDGDLTVVCPDAIRKIFEVTGLDRVLTITEAPDAVPEPAT